MRKALMITVSAIAILAASQQAFAIDKVSRQPSVMTSPNMAIQQNPNAGNQLKPPVGMQQQKMNAPAGTGAMNAFQNGRADGLSGVGVPGGLGNANQGGGLNRGSGFGGIAPSGAMGKAQDGIGGLKGSRGQSKGVQANEGPTGEQAQKMRKSIGEAAASRGKEKGVEGQEGATAKQSAVMRKAIGEAAEGRGQEKGVEAKEGGGKLSKEQRQSMKDMTFDPKVNPELGSKDPKGDGKGGGAGGKPSGPKPAGAGGKPSGPKPAGDTAGGKGGKGGGGKVAGVNPKTGGSKKEPAPKPKVLNGGKLIVFPAVTITPKPAKGPLDGVFKPKPDPKKTDASNLNVDSVTAR